LVWDGQPRALTEEFGGLLSQAASVSKD
jgi:hypothetical protein